MVTDRHSKLTRSILTKKTAAPQIATISMNKWVMPHHIFEIILKDNGPQSVSKFFFKFNVSISRCEAADDYCISSPNEWADGKIQNDDRDLTLLLRKRAPGKLGWVCSTVHQRVQFLGPPLDKYDFVQSIPEKGAPTTSQHRSRLGNLKRCYYDDTGKIIETEAFKTPNNNED